MAKISVLDSSPTGKVIVVTGGYGHLGKAISASLLKNGAIVYVAARNQEKFKNVFREELKTSEQQLRFLNCDINSSESIANAFEELIKIEGKLDGLINNAFGARGQSPYEMPRADFNYTLDGSLASVFDVIKFAIPHLSEGASIVNVSSMYGMVAPDFKAYKDSPEYLNPPHYGAAKAGVIQLSKYYASLLGEKGVRVNAVSPGPFPSEPIQKNETFMKELRNRTLLGRYGLPEELAGIFTFLMSDSAKFITGQNFAIDGGWTVR
ncbi:SDR family oxidoreductase [Schleiferiaceae bacterium]|nr:SDR family oxidoreductase [Schleiferiaceae bacterium]